MPSPKKKTEADPDITPAEYQHALDHHAPTCECEICRVAFPECASECCEDADCPCVKACDERYCGKHARQEYAAFLRENGLRPGDSMGCKRHLFETAEAEQMAEWRALK